MSEFNDPFPNYEMLAHHDEEHGKKARKKLWRVFWLLLGITILEIGIGIFVQDYLSPLTLKITFIGLTLVKAYFIVYTFMHLGDEERGTKWVIIAPYTAFILYLIVMLTVGEGKYTKTTRLDHPIPDEKVQQMHEAAKHHEAAPAGEHK